MVDSFEIGAAVVVRGSGEHGVILRRAGTDMVDVALSSGVRLIHSEELRLADPEPDQLLLAGDFGDPTSYALHLQSQFLRHAYRFDPLSGLSNARIEPQYHQVFVAWRVSAKLQPRMILADEVGLGKTIEAGLVIKELRARGIAQRVLVICPSSLQLQWQQELKTKFNEIFEILDGAAIKYLARGGNNPWAKFDSVICSLPFASHRSRFEAVTETHWDLVVFDEAHRVRRWLEGKKPKVTQAYRLADEIKERVSGLLMLTATPMQLHSYELYSLIELVEPGLFPTFQSYERQKRLLPRLNDLIRGLRSWPALSSTEVEELCVDFADLLSDTGLVSDAAEALASNETRASTIAALAETHPLADVMVRNRKSEVGGFVKRSASKVLVDLTPEEYDLYEEITAYCRYQYNRAMATKNNAVGFLMVTYQKMLASSSYAIRASFERRILKLRKQMADKATGGTSVRSTGPDDDQTDAEELSDVIDDYASNTLDGALVAAEIEQLQELVGRLGKVTETKAHQLLEALDEVFRVHPNEKVLIFTSFKETQSFLKRVLEGNGHSVSVFHGSLSLDEKEDAVRAFRAKNRVLISTEAGGEGRNFQFCHIVVNYDLPWNPMKVEQRIGRVDRIGQEKNVEIWNLACRGTVEERVLDVLDRRIGLFEESVGSLDPILGTLEDDIVELVMKKVATLADEGTKFEEDLGTLVRKARETDRQMADFALDQTSFRHDIVNGLLERRSLATHEDLERFITTLLRHVGGTVSPHSEGGQVMTFSPQASQRLRIKGSTVRGCFNPQEALRFEELPFFAFGNEVIESLLDIPEEEGVRAAARRDSDTPAGTWIEVWYELETTDVRPTGRFLRHLVGQDLVVHSELVTTVPSIGDRLDVPIELPTWAASALSSSREHFQDEYGQLRAGAKETLSARKGEESVRVDRIFDYRMERLRDRIDDERRWIERAEAGTNVKDKRILPARRGLLDSRRQALEDLRNEHAKDLQRIDAQEPVTMAKVLAAGIVVGG